MVFICWVSCSGQKGDPSGANALPFAEVEAITLTALGMQVSGHSSVLQIIRELHTFQHSQNMASVIDQLCIQPYLQGSEAVNSCYLPAPSTPAHNRRIQMLLLLLGKAVKSSGAHYCCCRCRGNRWKIGLEALRMSVMLEGLQITANVYSKSSRKITQSLFTFLELTE